MQIEKKVFSKLFKPKTALSKKVELNLVLDLVSISSTVKVWGNNVDISLNEIERLARETEEVKLGLEVDVEDLEIGITELENKIKAAEDAANDLGIDISGIDNFQIAQATLEDSQKYLELGKSYLR
jgi:CII-binding regulator of phage lambda lysogenization HflD